MQELSHTRYEMIKTAIVDMFEECEIDSCPIDSFVLADRLRYTIKPYEKLSKEAYRIATTISPDAYSTIETHLTTGMNHYVIYYNDTMPIRRIHWSILHEIGHIYLGHHDNLNDTEQATEEAEANFFAKYAIAPPPLIHLQKCSCPQDIYESFLTSREESRYAYEYYLKWRSYSPNYTQLELRLLDMFHSI